MKIDNINKIVYSILISGAILIVILYNFIDRDSGYYFIEQRDTVLFTITKFLSMGAKSTYFLIFSALGFLAYKYIFKNSAIQEKLAFFFLSLVVSGVISVVLKVFFGKARPLILKNDDFFGFTWLNFNYDYHSFPSGHTTTAFAIATSLALMFPRYIAVFYAYAITMGLVRIGCWAHFPSDVVAGAMVGTITVLFLYKQEKILPILKEKQNVK
ncbi:MAG: phosphatase PAP2 family protein [Helicobacteraceae bacterium]|nr:phosphatase PAP2 family protein [Helicobacteraceae bacterium]